MTDTEFAVIATIIVLAIVGYVAIKARRHGRERREEHETGELGKSAKPLMHEQINLLKEELKTQKITLDERMLKFEQTYVDDKKKILEETKKSIYDHTMKKVNDLLAKKQVTPDEFYRLKKRVEEIIGGDAADKRTGILAKLFDSPKSGVISWQCRLIKMLRGGLAPVAEELALTKMGIPSSKFMPFLRKMEGLKMVYKKDIPAYFLSTDSEWIYSYVDNPDQLLALLEKKVELKQEKQYQAFLRENMGLVESGMQFTFSEYELESGPIDFVCRDSTGRHVGIETKAKKATSRDIGQLKRYRDDYIRKTGADARFFMVAPEIHADLKEALTRDGFEWREVGFEDDLDSPTGETPPSQKKVEYVNYLANHLDKIDPRLEFEHGEYQVKSGKIDFICTAGGRHVGIVIKYPRAEHSDISQIRSCRGDYETKVVKGNSRFILVAPEIADDIKSGIKAEDLECCEVPFDSAGADNPDFFDSSK